MENKKGVTLSVLIITIVVMIILASVVVYTSADTTNNSKRAAFSSDLEQIEDLIDEYYLTNNELPIVGGVEYTKAEFTALVNTNRVSSLQSEIDLNLDTDSTFYKIDLSKLPIKDVTMGIEENGDVTDAYYVTNKRNVYYLKGRKIGKKYYFSLTEELTGKTKVASSETTDASNVSIVNVTNGIRMTKNTKDWTNNLIVTVETELKTGEQLEYSIAGTTVTNSGNSINVSNVLKNDSTLSNRFYSSDSNKLLVVKKKDSSNVVIAESSLNVSNVDTLATNESQATITHTLYNNFILAKVSGYTDLGGSGVKEIRVLYTTKASGSYYNNLPATITADYINNLGNVSDPTVIKLPIDVTGYSIIFKDNAGNLSAVRNVTVTY